MKINLYPFKIKTIIKINLNQIPLYKKKLIILKVYKISLSPNIKTILKIILCLNKTLLYKIISHCKIFQINMQIHQIYLLKPITTYQ